MCRVSVHTHLDDCYKSINLTHGTDAHAVTCPSVTRPVTHGVEAREAEPEAPRVVPHVPSWLVRAGVVLWWRFL